MKKIRTLMVDDSPEFLQAATRFLCIDPSIDIVAQIHRGREVLQAIQEHKPDLLLLDLAMPDLHGLDVIRQIREQMDEPPFIIVLTLHDNPEYRAQATALGASGFIYKSDFGTELLPTIHRLIPNGSNWDPESEKDQN
jgi:two-component system response regulator DesR